MIEKIKQYLNLREEIEPIITKSCEEYIKNYFSNEKCFDCWTFTSKTTVRIIYEWHTVYGDYKCDYIDVDITELLNNDLII